MTPFSFITLLRVFMAKRLKVEQDSDHVSISLPTTRADQIAEPLLVEEINPTLSSSIEHLGAGGNEDTRALVESAGSARTFFSSGLTVDKEMVGLDDVSLPGSASAADVAVHLCEERSVGYYVMQAEIWRFSNEFPLHANRQSFALVAAVSETVSSNTELTLVRSPLAPNPDQTIALKSYVGEGKSGQGHAGRYVVSHKVHPKTDRGYTGNSRWTSMADVLLPVYVNLAHKSLNQKVFTSSSLECDMEVTGYPTLVLWMATVHPHNSNGDPGDVFATLQCVDEEGEPMYVTEGCLRLKHRHFFDDVEAVPEGEDSCDSVLVDLPNLPKRSFRSEYGKLGPMGGRTGEPELAWLTMQPTSFHFRRGQRIRIAIYGADVDHFNSVADTDYFMNIWLGDNKSTPHELSMSSRLLLPVISSIKAYA
eukprot:CAMPEP_0182420616 /NCGR_PEP_ID=MMETSP1167-20130531/5535_1 /TAXON_ID=2988 /ORGANISM="Mallomonas Sp, Strain CCMP3275" /LENGTH=421 /DNA_ID=CAMNT_0024596795 /DNA_START=12 /DNA_END=1277 /DNA_ORIENTATION=-